MSDYYFDDYDKLLGKHITVIYECGRKCKKLYCQLLKCCEKNSKEKFIILKSCNNIIYHINCDKIIYWIAEYKDVFTENQEVYKSKIKPIQSNVIPESKDLFLEKTQNIETIPLQTSILSNQLDDTEFFQDEENVDSYSISSSKEDTSLEAVSNTAIISDEQDINYIVTDMKSNYDKIITDYKKDYNYNKILDQYNHKDTYKKNVFRSPLAAFINYNFQGVYLTIYTASAQSISGEVIFKYDYLIVLKSDTKTYYINPEQITYFC